MKGFKQRLTITERTKYRDVFLLFFIFCFLIMSCHSKMDDSHVIKNNPPTIKAKDTSDSTTTPSFISKYKSFDEWYHKSVLLFKTSLVDKGKSDTSKTVYLFKENGILYLIPYFDENMIEKIPLIYLSNKKLDTTWDDDEIITTGIVPPRPLFAIIINTTNIERRDSNELVYHVTFELVSTLDGVGPSPEQRRYFVISTKRGILSYRTVIDKGTENWEWPF